MNLPESLNFSISVSKYGGVGLSSLHRYENNKLFHEKGGDGTHKTVIVCSAMGKTTSALEDIFEALKAKKEGVNYLAEKILPGLISRFKFDHIKLIDELFQGKEDHMQKIKNDVEFYFKELKVISEDVENFFDKSNPNHDYTRQKAIILSLGELISSIIFSHYFNAWGIKNKWLDSRDFMKTSNLLIHEDASFDHTNSEINKIDTEIAITKIFSSVFHDYDVVVCQGYIGSDSDSGQRTLLGKNGSDYSAAVIGVYLKAKHVSFWKDQKALMTADPDKDPDAKPIFDLYSNEYSDLYHRNGEDGPVRLDSVEILAEYNIPAYIRYLDKPFSKHTIIYPVKN